MGDALVLTHGAGGSAASPPLPALAAALEVRGLVVQRYNLPFRQVRPKGPPSPRDAERDRAGLRETVLALRANARGRVFLGGQSYGGRQASMLAAAEPGLVTALLLLSYPLHPPGRPDKARTQHLGALRTPACFVHGATDPFATREELEAARALIPAQTALLELPGTGHDLSRGPDKAIGERIAAFFQEFVTG